jgi:hypothetical protein
MTASNPNRLGAANGGADKFALFEKVFTGEVMSVFATKNAVLDKHMVRTITHGKSASFPIMGRTSADYHTPGNEIVGKEIKHNEVVIDINGLLLTDVFIANIDEAMNHYDVRSHYATEMGNALSNQFDRHVFQMIVKAAQTSTPNISDETAMVGTIIENANAASDADQLINALFDAAQALDEKNVPEEDRFAYLPPSAYYLLANSSKVQNVDFGNEGNGSVAKGVVKMAAGFQLVKSNQVPTTQIASGSVDAGTSDRQLVDARNTVALVAHKSAVGTVKLMDLATESEYDIRRQGTLMVAKYAMGHGVLRPEAAVQIRTATPV